MNAHVLFNISNKSRKVIKYRLAEHFIISFFGNEFNKLKSTLWSMNVRYYLPYGTKIL